MDVTEVANLIGLVGSPTVNIVLAVFIYRLRDQVKDINSNIKKLENEIHENGFVRVEDIRLMKEGIDLSKGYLQNQITSNKDEILRLRDKVENLERRK